MRLTPFIATAVLATAAAFACGSVAAEQIYKWKDADGVVHYTDTPPPKGTEVDKVSVKEGPAPPAPVAEQTPASGAATGATPAATSAQSATQVAALRATACDNARKRQQQLASLPSVSMDLDKDGTPEQLNAEQHAAQLDRANQAVANYCGSQ
jgi:hypothetical protein